MSSPHAEPEASSSAAHHDDPCAAGLGAYGATKEAFLEAVESLVPLFQPTVEERKAKLRVSDRLRMLPLTGGMSNLLFIVERVSGPEVRVVARVLSPSLDAIIDRDKELSIFRQLSASGVSPRLYGIANLTPSTQLARRNSEIEETEGSDSKPLCIRVEQHLEGRTLTVDDFRKHSSPIASHSPAPAASAAALPGAEHEGEEHDATSAGALAERIVRLHEQPPTFFESLSTFAEHLQRYLGMIGRLRRVIGVADDAAPGLCVCKEDGTQPLPSSKGPQTAASALEQYNALKAACERLLNPENSTATVQQRLCRLLHLVDWEAEASFMLTLMDEDKAVSEEKATAGGGPLVLCHNDLQPGNWILATLQSASAESQGLSRNHHRRSSSSDLSGVAAAPRPLLADAATKTSVRKVHEPAGHGPQRTTSGTDLDQMPGALPSFSSPLSSPEASRPSSRASTSSAYEGRVRRADEPGLRTPSGRASRRGSGSIASVGAGTHERSLSAALAAASFDGAAPSELLWGKSADEVRLQIPKPTAVVGATGLGSGLSSSPSILSPALPSPPLLMSSASASFNSAESGSLRPTTQESTTISPNSRRASIEGVAIAAPKPMEFASVAFPPPAAQEHLPLSHYHPTHYPEDLTPAAFGHGRRRRSHDVSAEAGSRGRKQLFIIDYEYGGWNRRGFDLGNLLCEHTFDYSLDTHPGYRLQVEHYPSLQWQRQFCLTYAALWRDMVTASKLSASSGVPAHSRYLLQRMTPNEGHATQRSEGGSTDGSCRDELWARTSASPAAVTQAVPADAGGSASVEDDGDETASFARELLREGRVGVMGSHFYWSLWSAVMAAGKVGFAAAMHSPSEAANGGAGEDGGDSPVAAGGVASGHSVFDYSHYGLRRALEYLRLKAQWLADCE